MLTIAIPTYNRNSVLATSLSALLPQIQAQSDRCRLLLLDNCSDVPIADTLLPVLAQYPEVACQIVRNVANIGANANILRCFELCQTKWIWCLSDDDPVYADALTTVLEHLDAHPDCLYFNFSFDELRTQAFTTQGLEDFISQLDYSANLPWISNSVHRTAEMRANLKFGYQYAYSMLPHVANLLFAIGLQGQCYFSPAHLAYPSVATTEQQWPVVIFALGAPVLYDLPMPFATRQELSRKLLVTYLGESINLKVITTQLLLSFFHHKDRRTWHDKRNILHIFDQVVSRNYALDRSLSRWAQINYYRLLIKWPNLSERILRLLGRPGLTNTNRLQNSYERM